MFFKDSEKDINVKAAFLHLASDALVSLGLMAGGAVMYFTHSLLDRPLVEYCYLYRDHRQYLEPAQG